MLLSAVWPQHLSPSLKFPLTHTCPAGGHAEDSGSEEAEVADLGDEDLEAAADGPEFEAGDEASQDDEATLDEEEVRKLVVHTALRDLGITRYEAEGRLTWLQLATLPLLSFCTGCQDARASGS